MKPIIIRAYKCMMIHILCAGIVFGIYILSNFFHQELIVTILPILAILLIFLICFKLGKSWVESAIKNDRLVLATNIYFCICIHISLVTMIVFKYLSEYTEADKGIGLVLCFYWMVYSFNLIPGNINIKFILYFSTCVLLFIIARPTIGYGIWLLIGNIVGHLIQLYIHWKRYHEDSKILNQIEFEKNANAFLQAKFPEAVFTLNQKLEIINGNDKGLSLIKGKNESDFKEYAKNLINDQGNNLVEEMGKFTNLDNAQFINCNRGFEKDKMIVSSASIRLGAELITISMIRNMTNLLDQHTKHISKQYEGIIMFSASHEIRSQLNLISGNLEYLEKSQKYDINSIKIAKYASRIMEYKFNLLLDFVQIMNDKFFEHSKTFSIHQVVETIEEITVFFSSSKNINCTTICKNRYENLFFADYIRFISIVIHISLNAIKFTYQGNVEIEIYFENNFLFALISDNGIGINEAIAGTINQYSENENEDDFQLKNKLLNSMGQTNLLSGIGLSASALICKKLKGYLKIKVNKGKGTEVMIKIGCKAMNELFDGKVDDSCVNDSEETKTLILSRELKKFCSSSLFISDFKTQLKESISLKKLFVLVVDDQVFNINVLKNMLEILHIKHIGEAMNGNDAIKISIEKYSLFDEITIFMDIDMPILNGIEATKIIKEKDKMNKIRIIMLSAFNSEEIIRQSLDAGAIDFCVKPISFQMLKDMKEEGKLLY